MTNTGKAKVKRYALTLTIDDSSTWITLRPLGVGGAVGRSISGSGRRLGVGLGSLDATTPTDFLDRLAWEMSALPDNV